MRRTIALMLVLAGVAAGVLAAGSSGARQTQRTIGLITQGGAGGFFRAFETGGQSAATALGYHLAITEANDAPAQIRTIKSLVAQRAAASSSPAETCSCAVASRRCMHAASNRSASTASR